MEPVAQLKIREPALDSARQRLLEPPEGNGPGCNCSANEAVSRFSLDAIEDSSGRLMAVSTRRSGVTSKGRYKNTLRIIVSIKLQKVEGERKPIVRFYKHCSRSNRSCTYGSTLSSYPTNSTNPTVSRKEVNRRKPIEKQLYFVKPLLSSSISNQLLR